MEPKRELKQIMQIADNKTFCEKLEAYKKKYNPKFYTPKLNLNK